MAVRKEHDIQCNDIGCGAVPWARNWWQRFKDGNFSSRDWHGDTAGSAPRVDGSPGISIGRARGSGITSAITTTVVASRNTVAPRTFTQTSRGRADVSCTRVTTGYLRWRLIY